MMRLLKALFYLCAVTGIAAIGGVVWFAAQGISARPEPSELEATVARAARKYGIPRADRNRANPVLTTRGSSRAGMQHWADHCANCHGNDGSGDTAIGRGLYPRAPDMRRPDTQDLTDGELFYIIENGVKLTGMPAWTTGTPEGEQDSWHLVNFIRHLPDLTEEELAEIADLNPRGPAEWRALEEERRFLAGEIDAPPAAPEPAQGHDAHKGGHP
jgi:mono/diheme cytochrome c family protein